MVVSFYAVLGVEPTASQKEIRSAFRRCLLSVHPDKGGTAAKFRETTVAFETLFDAERRAQHDRELAADAVAPPPIVRPGHAAPPSVPSKHQTARYIDYRA